LIGVSRAAITGVLLGVLNTRETYPDRDETELGAVYTDRRQRSRASAWLPRLDVR
jgi:hypothetical protein